MVSLHTGVESGIRVTSTGRKSSVGEQHRARGTWSEDDLVHVAPITAPVRAPIHRRAHQVRTDRTIARDPTAPPHRWAARRGARTGAASPERTAPPDGWSWTYAPGRGDLSPIPPAPARQPAPGTAAPATVAVTSEDGADLAADKEASDPGQGGPERWTRTRTRGPDMPDFPPWPTDLPNSRAPHRRRESSPDRTSHGELFAPVRCTDALSAAHRLNGGESVVAVVRAPRDGLRCAGHASVRRCTDAVRPGNSAGWPLSGEVGQVGAAHAPGRELHSEAAVVTVLQVDELAGDVDGVARAAARCSWMWPAPETALPSAH